MGAFRAGADRLVERRLVPSVAVFVFAIRFVTPSLSAFLGVEGLDTSGFDAAAQLYAYLVPAIAAVLAALLALTWPGGFGEDRILVLTLLLAITDVALWLGEPDPAYRLLQGPWADVPLGLAASATVLAWGLSLEGRLRPPSPGRLTRSGLRTFYGGFAAAYLLGTLRFVDYRYATGAALPPGALWLLDYGPILILGLGSAYVWMSVAFPAETRRGGWHRPFVLPIAGVLAGVAVSAGLGGFILSNTLAWGAAYEIFPPTGVSLGFVGFAVGCFLDTARALRGPLPPPSWRLLVAGVSTAVLAGIVAFAGTLPSLAGILLGLVLAARGIQGRAPRARAGVQGLS